MFTRRLALRVAITTLTLFCLDPSSPAQNRGSYVAGINYPAGPPTVPTNTGYWLGGIAPYDVHTGDFNGDGKMDVVVAAECSSSVPNCSASNELNVVAVYLGNGDGTFQAPILSGPRLPGSLSTLVVGDFNGDGKLDVVVENDSGNNGGTITVLLGNGDGTFTQSSQYALGGNVGQSNTMAVGDFNGDGALDLVVGLVGGTISIYLGDGDGTFKSNPASYTTVGNSALYPVVGDFNGDGKLDVIAGSAYAPGDTSHSSLTVLLGNGDGTFVESMTTLTFAGLSSLAAADFNSDGILDLAVSTSPTGIQILLGKGNGAFQSPVSLGSSLTNLATNITGIAVADLNNDGKPDLVISGSLLNENAIQLYLNDGTGNFVAGPAYGLGGSEFAFIAAQDFNGDGNVDIVMASTISRQQGGEGSVSILLGNGDGTMQAAMLISQISGHILGPEYAAVSADVNGDGIPDLIEATQAGVLVFLGTGNGKYAPPTLYVVGAFALAVGDFNKDGKLDIAVAGGCLDASCTQGGVSILLGNGDGTFQAPVSYGTGGQNTLSLALGDFNGDGNLDVAVANQSSSVSILLGNGDGTLQPAVVTAAGSQNLSIAAADFNQDGKTDLALDYYDPVASRGWVQVLLSGENGTLSAKGAPYSSGGNGYEFSIESGSVAIADVNGDGNLDIVVANQCQSNDTGCSYGSLAVLTGNGDGTFQSGSIQSVPDGHFFSLLLADVNGDGILDAIASDPTGVEVLLGKGDGSFLPPTIYEGVPSTGYNTILALSDLNIIQPGEGEEIGGSGATAILVNKAGTYLVTKSSDPSSGLLLTTTASASYLTGITPTGSISYYDGTTLLGSAALVGGTASFNVSSLSLGVHTITSYYSGDSNFNAHYGTPILTLVAPFSLTCSATNTGEVNVAFNSGPQTVTGGTAPYTFSVATGAVPAGLTLNVSTGAVTGTPAAAGSFTMQVKDANGVVATGTCPISITSATPTYQLTTAANPTSGGTVTPASGSSYPAGTVVSLTAAPSAGYVFSSWTASPVAVASANSASTTVTMTGPESVTANFISALNVAPSSINFGTVYQGTITTKNVTVTNTGTTAIAVTGPIISIVKGGNSNEFVEVNECPKSLAGGSHCTISISFVAGPFYTPQTATLSIMDNAPGNPQTVMLTATVIDPQASFKPASLSFGTQAVNTSATKTMTLTNTGATTLSLFGMTVTGQNASDFTLTPSSNCGSSVSAGSNCTISVTFEPTTTGPLSATLQVTDNTRYGTQTVALSGTGH